MIFNSGNSNLTDLERKRLPGEFGLVQCPRHQLLEAHFPPSSYIAEMNRKFLERKSSESEQIHVYRPAELVCVHKGQFIEVVLDNWYAIRRQTFLCNCLLICMFCGRMFQSTAMIMSGQFFHTSFKRTWENLTSSFRPMPTHSGLEWHRETLDD